MRKLILSLALIAPAALAGGYIVPNTNPRDLSMAGSDVAAQESAAATYANPSALSKLEGLAITAGAGLIDFRSAWTDPGNQLGTISMIPKGAFPPAIYAAYGGKLPGEMRWGVGAGLNIPGGGYVFWPGNWPGQTQVVTVDRKVYGVYLTGGLQVL